LGAAAGALLCLGLLPAAGPAAAAGSSGPSTSAAAQGEKLGNYDSRRDGTARQVLQARSAALAANPRAGVRALRKKLGMEGIVDLDPVTATPRRVTRVDGFLTGPSRQSAKNIALNYVKANSDAFGISPAAVDSLTLRQDYVDIAGTHHLSFTQSAGGVPVFGNGLKAHVAKDGSLIQLDGAPVASLPAQLGTPGITAQQGRDRAVEDVFGSSKATIKTQAANAAKATEFSNGDRAQLVVFQGLSGPRLAWQVITLKEGFISVMDAQSGRVLFRQSTSSSDSATTWDNYPGAAVGGTQQVRNLTAPGWLPNNSPKLAGNVAHVYLDLNDDDMANPGEEVPPSGNKKFQYPFTVFGGANCVAGFQCSWDPDVPFSWQTNAYQDATQMFYFLGKMHDHLAANPIGFTRAAGNFEAVDDDAVQGNAIDGANTDGGLPDANHVDNANMNTPPDGIPPRMQMYLFHQPGTLFPDEDPFIAGNSGDEADIVYHEYTHGLSNRLVVDASGISTLGNIQAGSMGEAWSDWYALDFLVKQGFFTDSAADGELRVGPYVGWGNDLIRTQPIDCPVGSTSVNCPGTPGGGPGGYTYGDFGRIIGRPEVHADGEIWVETLWDLRKALGSNLTESLVTRAMELSPANPSYLDMRNSILTADLVVDAGKKQAKIWEIFAGRGMGWFAGAVDGDDAFPVEDFSTPPSPNTPRGTLTGTVRDRDTNALLVGATVAFGGHNSGFAGDYAATTNASGVYTITGILPGTYPKVFARSGAGYDPNSQTVSVPSHTVVLNWQLRRDWAALSGGATITDFNGDDFTIFGCGAPSMFDQSQGSGWSTDAVLTNPADHSVIDPRFVTVQLPAPIDIIDLQINPSGTCGDGASAGAGDFTVETSTDGVTFVLAASGHFGIPSRGKMNSVPLTAGTGTDVRFVRYTMRGTQLHDSLPGATCPTNASACLFVDSVELAVYGTP
jgi:hypothetical protein